MSKNGHQFHHSEKIEDSDNLIRTFFVEPENSSKCREADGIYLFDKKMLNKPLEKYE